MDITELTFSMVWRADGLGPYQGAALGLLALMAATLVARLPGDRRVLPVRALTALSLLAILCSLPSLLGAVGVPQSKRRHTEPGGALICTGGVWVWKR